MKTLLMGLVLSALAVGCGTDEGGHKTVYLPVCCEGRVASNPDAVLMCKDDASNERSSIVVRRSETGMISTMQEMKYETCQ